MRTPVGYQMYRVVQDNRPTWHHYVVCDDGTLWHRTNREPEWRKKGLAIPGTKQPVAAQRAARRLVERMDADYFDTILAEARVSDPSVGIRGIHPEDDPALAEHLAQVVEDDLAEERQKAGAE